MTSRLNKIKGLMVAASESLEGGSRETASNLMELALNEMQHVSPEDLEINLQVVDYEPEEAATVTVEHANALYSRVGDMLARARAERN